LVGRANLFGTSTVGNEARPRPSAFCRERGWPSGGSSGHRMRRWPRALTSQLRPASGAVPEFLPSAFCVPETIPVIAPARSLIGSRSPRRARRRTRRATSDFDVRARCSVVRRSQASSRTRRRRATASGSKEPKSAVAMACSVHVSRRPAETSLREKRKSFPTN
jgi:hypothetical protein